MPDLGPIRSAPTPASRPSAQPRRTGSYNARAAPLQRVFSAQHLDDVSNYHHGDHDAPHNDRDDDTESSDESEKIRDEDNDNAAEEGQDEVPESRMGVPDTRDLEANLEKKQSKRSSKRSIKDPNLVRAIGCILGAMTVLLTGCTGLVGWLR